MPFDCVIGEWTQLKQEEEQQKSPRKWRLPSASVPAQDFLISRVCEKSSPSITFFPFGRLKSGFNEPVLWTARLLEVPKSGSLHWVSILFCVLYSILRFSDFERKKNHYLTSAVKAAFRTLWKTTKTMAIVTVRKPRRAFSLIGSKSLIPRWHGQKKSSCCGWKRSFCQSRLQVVDK